MSQSVAADVELPPTLARCLSSGGPRMREWRLLRPTLLCPRGLRWRSPHEARGDGAPNTSKKCDVKHWFGGDLASALSKELTICVEVWKGRRRGAGPESGSRDFSRAWGGADPRQKQRVVLGDPRRAPEAAVTGAARGRRRRVCRGRSGPGRALRCAHTLCVDGPPPLPSLSSRSPRRLL